MNNSGLTRRTTYFGIEYMDAKGRCVKYINFSGGIGYDDARPPKSRAPFYWKRRKDGGPCTISPSGVRTWHDVPKKRCYTRQANVGNNKRSNHRDYRFVPIMYGVKRIETTWCIFHVVWDGFSRTGKSLTRQIKTIFKDGRMFIPPVYNGPSFIGGAGHRVWGYRGDSLFNFDPRTKGNPKKTWGNSEYIVERYEYPKT